MLIVPPAAKTLVRCVSALAFAAAISAGAQNQSSARPWMNKSLSPDQRADLAIQQMTLDEKMNFVHGTGWNGLRPNAVVPKGSLGGAGYVEGV